MDVVDDEEVESAEFFAELGEGLESDGIDVFVGELFGGDVAPACVCVCFCEVIADALEEVCFADTAGAVDEEAWEGGRFVFDHGAGA